MSLPTEYIYIYIYSYLLLLGRLPKYDFALKKNPTVLLTLKGKSAME